ncbi:MAG: hypothetical protein GY811_01915 [Myxococcales bacterium]|nr:hypothetical protein [Myxococcales bacterium]
MVQENDHRWERLLVTIENFVLARVKEKPPIYVMEDLHLADSMTLRVASRLAAMPRTQSFLFVGTYRPSQGLDEFLVGLDHDFEIRNLGLRETRDSIRGFFSETGVDERLAIQLWERTRGNARQLSELLHFLRNRGLLMVRSGIVRGDELSDTLLAQLAPPAMEKQALARLDEIGPDDRRMLHMAAAIGSTVPCRVLRQLDPSTWSTHGRAAMTNLIDEGILVSEFANTPSYRFRDDQVRIVAYSTIPLHRKRMLHGKIADIIERLNPGDHDHRAPTLALHRERAGQTALAMHWYARATQRSASLMLDAETVEYVSDWNALAATLELGQEPPICEQSRMAVLRFVATARHFGAEDALEQARHIAATFREEMTLHEKAVCDLWHGAALMAVGQKNSARARFSRAYECDTYSSVRCDAALRLARCMMDNSSVASQWIGRAAALVRKPDSHWADRVQLARACQAVAEGHLDEARILNSKVRDKAMRAGRVRLAAIATSNLADCDLRSGDVEDARRGFAEANIMSRSLGTRTDQAIDALNRGVSEFYVGNTVVAHEHLKRSAATAKSVGCKSVSTEARIYLGIILAIEGEIDEGEEVCLATREDAQGDESLEFLLDLNLLHIAMLRVDKNGTDDLLRRCQRAPRDKLSPLLRDRLSQLRSLARPVLRA